MKTFAVGTFCLCSVALCATTIAACGTTTSISGPSALNGVATINGRITSTTPGPLVVAASGTSASSPVATDGRFTLSGIPAGDVQLEITGGSVNARLPIGSVAPNEVLTVAVRVSANGATLESLSRNGVQEMEVTGRVSGLSGSCPSLAFAVNGRSVRTSAATLFRRLTCELLVNGQIVEVEGHAESSGAIAATKVQLEDDEDEAEIGIERRGTVAGLAGTCPNVTFSVGGQIFFTNSSTQFDRISCAALRNGAGVEVKGHRQSNGQALAERVRPR